MAESWGGRVPLETPFRTVNGLMAFSIGSSQGFSKLRVQWHGGAAGTCGSTDRRISTLGGISTALIRLLLLVGYCLSRITIYVSQCLTCY